MTESEARRTSHDVTPSVDDIYVDPAMFDFQRAELRRTDVRRRQRGSLRRMSVRRRVSSAVAVGLLTIVGVSITDAAIQRSVDSARAASTNTIARSLAANDETFSRLSSELLADGNALTRIERSTKATLAQLDAGGSNVASTGGTITAAASTVTSPPAASPAPVVVAPATHATTGASRVG